MLSTDEEKTNTSINTPLVDVEASQPIGIVSRYEQTYKKLKQEKQALANQDDDLIQRYTDIASSLKEEKIKSNNEIISQNLAMASLGDADREAEIQRLAKESGTTPELVRDNYEQIQRLVLLKNIDAKGLSAYSPILAEQLKNPLFAALAYDDLEPLTNIESIATHLMQLPRSLVGGTVEGLGGLAHAFGGVFGSLDELNQFVTGEQTVLLKPLSDWLHNQGYALAETGADIEGDMSKFSWQAQDMYSGISSVGMTMPGILAFLVTKNPNYILVPMSSAVGGMSTGEALEQGMSPTKSLIYGATDAGIEYVTERLPLYHLVKKLKVDESLPKMILAQMGIEGVTEQFATIFQDFNEWATLPSEKDRTFQDYVNERPEAALHTLIATMTAVSLQTPIMYAGNKVAQRFGKGVEVDPFKEYINNASKAEQAQKALDLINEITEKLNESKTLERSKDAAKNFIKTLFQSKNDESIPNEILIEANELVVFAQENNIDLSQIPIIQEQLQEAIDTGGFISMPVEDYVTDLSTQEFGPQLNELIRLHEDSMSVKEASEWSEEANQKLIDRADEIIQNMPDQEQANQVYDQIVAQLVEAGTPRDQATKNAELYRAFFAVMADRTDVDMLELYERYGLKVTKVMDDVGVETPEQISKLVDLILAPKSPLTETVKKEEVVKPKGKTLEDLLQVDEVGNVVNRDEMIDAIIEAHFQEYPLGEQAEERAELKNPAGMEGAKAGRAAGLRLQADKRIISLAKKEITEVNLEKKRIVLEEEQLEIKVSKAKKAVEEAENDPENQTDEFLFTIENPARIAALEAEIELLRFKQSNKAKNQSGVNSFQREINEKLKRIAKLQDDLGIESNKEAEFVEEATPIIDFEEVVEQEDETPVPETKPISENLVPETKPISTETPAPVENELGISEEQLDSIRTFLAESGMDLATATPEEVISAIQDAMYNPEGQVLDQSAFHGTGLQEVFDQFSTDYIGTGEGFQAFGWGLYFTDKQSLAEHYKKKNSRGRLTIDGRDVATDGLELVAVSAINANGYDGAIKHEEERLELYKERLNFKYTSIDEIPYIPERNIKEAVYPIGGDLPITEQRRILYGDIKLPEIYYNDKYLGNLYDKNVRNLIDLFSRIQQEQVRKDVKEVEDTIKIIKSLKGKEIAPAKGKVYQVELMPQDDEWLLWDEVIEYQSKKVQKIINSLPKTMLEDFEDNEFEANRNFGGDDFYKFITRWQYNELAISETSSYKDYQDAASKYLHSIGIKGIKFWNGNTRNKNLYKVLLEGQDLMFTNQVMAAEYLLKQPIGIDIEIKLEKAIKKVKQQINILEDDLKDQDSRVTRKQHDLEDQLEALEEWFIDPGVIEIVNNKDYNFVVFNDEDIEITKTFNQMAAPETPITKAEDITPHTVMYHITATKNIEKIMEEGLQVGTAAINSRYMWSAGVSKASKIFAWSDFSAAQRYWARSRSNEDVSIIAFKSGEQTWEKDTREMHEQTAFKTSRKKKGVDPANIPPENILQHREIDDGDLLNRLMQTNPDYEPPPHLQGIEPRTFFQGAVADDNLSYKDIKLVGKPFEESGDEWHQEFTIKGHEFSPLLISLIDGKHMPHVNPHELDGKGNSIKEQALDYFRWFHKEYFDNNHEPVPSVFKNKTFFQGAVADNQNLVRAYHSTDQKFDTFENPQIGFHFAANPQLANQAAIKNNKRSPLIEMERILTIEDPLVINKGKAPANGWSAWGLLDLLAEMDVITSKEFEKYNGILDSYEDKLGAYKISENQYDISVSKLFKDILNSKGFDSIKYWNSFDAGPNINQMPDFLEGKSKGIPEADWSYIVFDNKQIQQPTKEFFQGAVEPQALREGEVLHYHSSPNVFDQFEINENRLGGTYPSGIYSHPLKERTMRPSYGDNVYKIAVELGKVGTYYPNTPKDINQAMEDKYVEVYMRTTPDLGPSHINWVEAQAIAFRKSGDMKGRFSGLEKREIWLAGGYDTIKDGGDYISLHPEAVRILEVNGKPAPPMREFFQSAKEPTLEEFIAQKQGIPTPESNLLTTLYGRVEKELQELVNKKGGTENLTTRRLSKLFGAPKKRKEKTKFDKNVRPTSYQELKQMLEWSLANNNAGDWYIEFGKGFLNIVGKANLQEASILFGITSAQNAAELNYSETLHIMALARQFNPITQEKEFRKALRETTRPLFSRDGKEEKAPKLMINGQQIDNVVRMYKSGTYKGGLKVSTYMQLVRARAENKFNPWSVQDVHMARALGYRYRDIKKKTGKLGDAAKFPSSAAIRYGMWMTNKLAEEYNMRPDSVQANLWFYAKQNLSTKNVSDKETIVGDGTFESATNYSSPEIKVIQDMVAEGSFNKRKALTTALETGKRPSFTSDVKSDPFTNSDYNDLLLALAEARAPKILVSSNPGNDRGYGFPKGTTLEELSQYNQEVLQAITDEDGQIKLLREMGIVHKVRDTFGTFQRVEPTFHITFPGETFETAQLASKLLGEALMQDGTITEKTKFEGQQFGVRIKKADGSKFTTDDLVKIYQQINPESKKDGLNFTRTDDGTGLKLLDDNYWNEDIKYGTKELDAFQDLMSQYFSTEEYNIGLIAQESEYYDHTQRSRSNRQKIWDRSGTEGRSDLQRTAISSLYQPVHEVYKVWQRRLDFNPENETSALAELLEVSEDKLQKELAQKTFNQEERGSIQFRSSETIISLFEGSDRSTFLHESGHFFLQVIQDLAEDPNPPKGIAKDWDIILNYLGVEKGTEIGVEEHEKWARAFEKYLFEGKAPSVELQGAFSRFKAWLKSVYQQAVNLNVEINDDIRGVFDRILATPEQIQQAKQVSQQVALFKSAAEAGMTEAEFKVYQVVVDDSDREAEAELDHMKLKEVVLMDSKEVDEEHKKVKLEVEKEVNDMIVYQVIHFLETGKMIDGSPAVFPHVKLNTKLLKKEFGPEIIGLIYKGRNAMHEKDGVHHDEIATMFGFRSGRKMIEEIRKAKSRKNYIDDLTYNRMEEKYGALHKDEEKLKQEAIKANYKSKKLSRQLQIEAKALAKKIGKSTDALAAEQAAKEIIAKRLVTNFQLGKFRQAAEMAGRRAERAMLKQNFVEALKQKELQVINFHLYKQAVLAQERVEKIIKHLDKFKKPGTRKNIEQDYLDRIDSVLELYDLKKSVSQAAIAKRKTFAAWLAEQEVVGNKVVITPKMQRAIENATKKHYKEMTFEELEELDDYVKNLEHLGRRHQKLLNAKDAREMEELIRDMLHTTLRDLGPAERDEALKDITEKGWWGETVEATENIATAHDKTEFLFEFMDGFKDNGVWWRTAYKPIADGANKELEMQEYYITRLQEIFEKHFTKAQREAWMDKIDTELDIVLDKSNIISMALNMGNQYNQESMYEGFENDKEFNINRYDIDKIILDNMEANDWQAVQDIWDLINELWPEVAKQEKLLTGVVPKKVESHQVVTKFGVLRGGYYPIVFDSKRGQLAKDRADKADTEDLMETTWRFPITRHGHTKGRTNSAKQFIDLNMNIISRHIMTVIHDVSFRIPVMEINRLMKKSDIRNIIVDHAGQSGYDQIKPWLQGIANDVIEDDKGLDKFLRRARHSSSIVSMGMKLSTALMQPFGWTQSVYYLGARWAGNGLMYYTKNPIRGQREAFTKSTFMRNRSKTFDRDVRDVLRRLTGQDTKLKKIQEQQFILIQVFDMAVSLPTWHGGYAKAISEGMNEEDAIAMGDMAVRKSQGSGGPQDLAAIQRGSEKMKMWGQFYSYFNTLWQANKRNYRMRKYNKISSFQAAINFLLTVTIPAIGTALLMDDGPDDDEEFWWWALKQQPLYVASSIIGVRELGSFVQYPMYGIEPPLADLVTSIFGAGKRVVELLGDEDSRELDLQKDISKGILAFAYIFKLPGREVDIMWEHFTDVIDGEDFNLWEFLVKNNEDD